MKTIILNKTEASTLRDVLEHLNISTDSAPGHPELPLAPEGLPPFPPVPEGFDAWEYRGTGWESEKAYYGFYNGEEWDTSLGEAKASGVYAFHYIEPVKRPVQPPVMQDNLPPLPAGTVYLGLGETIINPEKLKASWSKNSDDRKWCSAKAHGFHQGWTPDASTIHYATEIDSLLHKAQPWYQPQEPEPALKAKLSPSEIKLRDRFAMSALTTVNFNDCPAEAQQLAEYAYEVADAMLEARKRS